MEEFKYQLFFFVLMTETYNRIRQAYDTSRNLVNKASDKLLVGAITLDTILGNPSTAFAQESSRGLSTEGYILSVSWTSIGIVSGVISLASKDKGYRRNFGLASIAFIAIGALPHILK